MSSTSSLARREDVEDDPAARHEQLARGGERPEAVGLGRHVQERAERDSTSGTRSVDRRLAHVAEPEIEQLLDAFGRAYSRATSSIPADASTPIRRMPAFAIGIEIRPVPQAELDDRPAGARASAT